MAGAMVVGQLAPKSWMRVELSPGWHAMRCITADSANPSSITLAPGDIRYVDVEMPAGAQACTIREQLLDFATLRFQCSMRPIAQRLEFGTRGPLGLERRMCPNAQLLKIRD